MTPEQREYMKRVQKLMRALEWAANQAGGLLMETSFKDMPAMYDLLETVLYELNWASSRVPDRYQKDTGRELPDTAETESEEG